MPAHENLELSIVIPTHNRKHLLRCLLKALGHQSQPALSEVIVVDDRSTDGTADSLAQLALPFRLRVLKSEGRGAAAARNRGLAEATAPIILFLDDDIIPSRDLLEQHLRVHRADDDAVVIGRLCPTPGDRLPGWERWEQRILDRTYRRVLSGVSRPDGVLFYTGNVSARRSSLLALGGFDVSLAYHEDVDLGRRLQAAGAHFQFASGASVLHCGHHTFAGWCRRHYQFGRHRLDRLMRAEPGQLRSLGQSYRECNALTRWLVRLTVGRPLFSSGVTAGLAACAGTFDALRLWLLSGFAYSALANLHHYAGLHDAAGGRKALWQVLGGELPQRQVARGDRDGLAEVR